MAEQNECGCLPYVICCVHSRGAVVSVAPAWDKTCFNVTLLHEPFEIETEAGPYQGTRRGSRDKGDSLRQYDTLPEALAAFKTEEARILKAVFA